MRIPFLLHQVLASEPLDVIVVCQLYKGQNLVKTF